MTVLTPANAFIGTSFSQHFSGQAVATSYNYPGALQLIQTGPKILSWTNAFIGDIFSQHSSGEATVQGYVYPGALQPLQGPAFIYFQQISTINFTASVSDNVKLTIHNP